MKITRNSILQFYRFCRFKRIQLGKTRTHQFVKMDFAYVIQPKQLPLFRAHKCGQGKSGPISDKIGHFVKFFNVTTSC